MSAPTDKGQCPQLEQVSLYVLHALPQAEAALLVEHLRECGECQQELADLGPLVASFVSWPTDVLRPAESVWGRLAQRIGIDAHTEAVGNCAPWVDPQWEEVAPGIACKLLASDTQRSRISMLVRLAPGAHYPPHTHAGIEELHLLHGELWIDERKLSAGDYNRAEAPSGDARVWSETGCTCVLITSTRDILL